ncbi:methylenetetrahydrofolate reductase [Nocardia miyunensis]|uniref:methylenetetrahydrofolate reductase n=1 Tax=Nocardia miyunensis TaxID=282684 RepID=UPI00082DC8C9|nr:methylenetetrahydrofolate reductase [Nocardia miyunensis]
MRDLILNAQGAPVLGAYVVPRESDREQAARAAAAVREAGADLVVTATSGPERSRYTSTNQAIDLAATCHDRTGVPAVATVTTWSRTVMALQAHLLGGHARGVTRLVCGNGSAPSDEALWGESRWAVDVVELIELLGNLNEGIDRHGLRLETPTHFDIGVRIRAVPRLTAADRARIRRKIDAGAHFIVTSPVYRAEALEPLLDVIDGDVPVVATLHALGSAAEADLLRDELARDCIPAKLVRRMEGAADGAAEEGGNIAVEVAAEVATATQGVLLSRSDQPDLVSRIKAVLPRPVVKSP